MGVINLADAKDISQVGGKAAALGALVQADFNVPAGFVITDYNESEILQAFDRLASPFVAVRSSATAEDSGNAAWAGQFETFVNVSRADLLEKVKQCFESGNSDRAQAYAQAQGLNGGKVAVIVQDMVQGDVSGVAFSVNPINHDADQMVIEAALGLNEAVVSGQITPDSYVISKSTENILSSNIVNQTKKLVLTNNKNEWVEVTDGNGQKLRGTQIAEVANCVKSLEKQFGLPVDVEWTFSGKILYILQCRPITTLK